MLISVYYNDCSHSRCLAKSSLCAVWWQLDVRSWYQAFSYSLSLGGQDYMCYHFWFLLYSRKFENFKILPFTVDFNLLFTQMFRTSQIRCQVQKFIMKFTNRFVNKASDWLLNQTSQSNAQFINLFVNFIMNFWTWQRICEVRNIWVKSKLKSTVNYYDDKKCKISCSLIRKINYTTRKFAKNYI
jgi:hypothetical protein